jgi:hypothetical protein
MKNIFNHILILLLLTSCASNLDDQIPSERCKQSKTCSISGMLTIKGDRGFIGELQVEKGKCVNISLPDDVSKKLIDKDPVKITVKGLVSPYPPYYEISKFLINGRKVGFGWCDDFYIFVKDGDFEFENGY